MAAQPTTPDCIARPYTCTTTQSAYMGNLPQSALYKHVCPEFSPNEPVWARLLLIPRHDFGSGGKTAMAITYFLVTLYLFLGISVASHIFMLSIEVIVSKTRISKSKAKEENGVMVEEHREVKIWNDTIANLTLMAFGSSAPEILLSIIETVGNDFCPGALGPGTIVGSASYNLMIITAVCIVSVPTDTTKRIKEYKVFVTTSGFAMFAYIWLVFIIQVVTHDRVESWEAILTLCYFPILILVAYWAEYNFCLKGKPVKRASVVSTIHDPSVTSVSKNEKYQPIHRLFDENWDNMLDDDGKINPEAIQSLYRTLNKIAVLSDEEIASILATRLLQTKGHSVLWYKIRAIEGLSAKTRTHPVLNDKLKEVMDVLNDMKRNQTGRLGDLRPKDPNNQDPNLKKQKAIIQFTSTCMAVPVKKGVFTATLKRGGREDITVFAQVTSHNGTAKNDVYEKVDKHFVFDPYVLEQKFYVKVLSDAISNKDSNFFLKVALTQENVMQHVMLGPMTTMEIVLISIDDPGEVQFTKKGQVANNTSQSTEIEIERVNGTNGPVTVKWRATPKEKCTALTAPIEGVVTLQDNEIKKTFEVPITPASGSAEDEQFDVQLVEVQGGAGKIGGNAVLTVAVTQDPNYKLKVNKLIEMIEDKVNIEQSIVRQTYLEQIKSAYIVNGDREEAKRATRTDVIMHWASLPYKAIFCFLPTPYFLGGWPCFILTLCTIGLLTTIVGDLANIVGWCLHLDPVTTGITLVAMGTSLPDTFASRIAALQDKTADAAIGNITGSNCVNVFLGLGLPWTIASLYSELKYKETLRVESDTLAMIVTIYTCVAIMAQIILFIRRHTNSIGAAELGGPSGTKYLTATFLVVGWLFYVVMSFMISQNIVGLGDMSGKAAAKLHLS